MSHHESSWCNCITPKWSMQWIIMVEYQVAMALFLPCSVDWLGSVPTQVWTIQPLPAGQHTSPSCWAVLHMMQFDTHSCQAWQWQWQKNSCRLYVPTMLMSSGMQKGSQASSQPRAMEVMTNSDPVVRCRVPLVWTYIAVTMLHQVGWEDPQILVITTQTEPTMTWHNM